MGLKHVETGFNWLPVSAKLQDRHGRPDLSRALVSHFIAGASRHRMAWHGTARHGFEAGARCHSMAWGLVIQDEDCMARLFSMIIRSHNMLINVVMF